MSPQHVIGIIIPVLLIAFGIYRRVRRSIGFQPLIRRRLTIRVVFLCIGALLLLPGALRHGVDIIGMIVGLAVGFALAWVAIRTTVFSDRDGRPHYRPHTWVGVAVLALFLGRLAYRFLTFYTNPQLLHGAAATPGQSGSVPMYSGDPLTIATMYVLVSYYIIYYLFLLRKRTAAAAGVQTAASDGQTSAGSDGGPSGN